MAGFRLGDHEFLDASAPPAPLDRWKQQPRAPIRGAVPPTFLEGVAVEATVHGPAAALMDGSFCGHGEPTFTVFDLAIDGERELNVAVPFEDGDEPTVLVRRAGRNEGWRKLFSIHELFERCGYEGEDGPPEPITDKRGEPLPVRLAIGFEYAPDARAVDDISWIAIAMEYKKRWKRKREIIFSQETA